MHIYTCTCRIHIDAIIKTSEDFFKKYTSHFICKVCVWEGELETKQNCNILTPTHQHCLSCSTGLLNRKPGGPLCWMLAFSTASCHQRVSKFTGGSPGPLLLGGGFLYHILSPTSLVSKLTDFQSSPSYIIVQSPTQYFWNGMFDCHQVEITVMQFTGHSFLVHQSMTLHWDFNLSHIISQACLRDFFP